MQSVQHGPDEERYCPRHGENRKESVLTAVGREGFKEEVKPELCFGVSKT